MTLAVIIPAAGQTYSVTICAADSIFARRVAANSSWCWSTTRELSRLHVHASWLIPCTSALSGEQVLQILRLWLRPVFRARLWSSVVVAASQFRDLLSWRLASASACASGSSSIAVSALLRPLYLLLYPLLPLTLFVRVARMLSCCYSKVVVADFISFLSALSFTTVSTIACFHSIFVVRG